MTDSQHKDQLNDHVTNMVDNIRATTYHGSFAVMGDFNDLDTLCGITNATSFIAANR